MKAKALPVQRPKDIAKETNNSDLQQKTIGHCGHNIVFIYGFTYDRSNVFI